MNYKQIVLFAVSYRFLILILLLFFPFNHQVFGIVTPFSFQSFADYNFYSNFGEFKIFSKENFLSNYKNILTIRFDLIDNRFPGPLFSILIFLTNYSAEYPYLMAIVIFVCELFHLLDIFFCLDFLVLFYNRFQLHFLPQNKIQNILVYKNLITQLII